MIVQLKIESLVQMMTIDDDDADEEGGGHQWSAWPDRSHLRLRIRGNGWMVQQASDQHEHPWC